ncbi:MAG: HlyC/CorC family transporter [Clostridia bacterium]|nr:HlyC/CorC family transporter [Clostridia bacterium]
MGSDRTSTILFMCILVALSAFFSATETAFSSMNRIKVKNQADNGDKTAKLMLKLADRYDKLLTTILIGNNIVNITLSSVGTLFFISLFPDNGATISTLVVTIVVLIFGEISPKSMAKEAPEGVASFAAPIMKVLMWVMTPVTFLFSLWKKLLTKLIKVNPDTAVSEEELLTIVEEAEQGGGIDEEESELIRNAIEFTGREAQDILIPRVDVEAVAVSDDKESIYEKFRTSNFSRMPVYEENIDHIVGVIVEKDFHHKVYDGNAQLTDVMKKPVFISEGMELNAILKLLQKNKSHMAIVADEYGGTVGIVTMEDILEELVGEIWDEHDEIVEEIQEIGPDCYRVLCTIGLDRLLNFFDIREEPDAATVNGWVMAQLGKIPEPGDVFTYNRLTVEVVKVEERRTEELRITAEVEENEE